MTGRIERTVGVNPSWEIQADGYKAVRYMDYSKAEAIQQYCKSFGLQGKHIEWREYLPYCTGKRKRPTNLYDAVIEGLKAGVL